MFIEERLWKIFRRSSGAELEIANSWRKLLRSAGARAKEYVTYSINIRLLRSHRFDRGLACRLYKPTEHQSKELKYHLQVVWGMWSALL